MFGWLLINLALLILVPAIVVVCGIAVAIRKGESAFLYLGGLGGFILFWALFVLSLVVWGIVLVTSGF
jgi:hypothetical protein